MQLSAGEHCLLCFFPSSSKASQASKKIIQAGLVADSESIQVDRVSRYGLTNDSNINNPINNAKTISGLTLYGASNGSDGSNPLLAASDSASGMAGTGAGMAGGETFMLTVVTKDENVEHIVGIIKNCGGRI